MNKTLKYTLMHSIQMIDHDFMCLELSIGEATDLQMRSLDTLSISIDKLRSTIHVLPISTNPVCSMVRHDIYNHLTVIGGFAQVLMHKRAGYLAPDTIMYLNKIIETSKQIEAALQAEKAANALTDLPMGVIVSRL